MTELFSTRFEEALVYAARLHSGQRRKSSNIPYISHLMSVAALVIEHGGSEDEAIAALLHDAVEDQGGAEVGAEIARRFGERVAAIVEGCTEAEEAAARPWRQRKEHHIDRVREASEEVLRVVAADKIHNVRSLITSYRRHGEDLWERFSGGREGTLWYYRTMLETIRPAAPRELVEELERSVEELEGVCNAG